MCAVVTGVQTCDLPICFAAQLLTEPGHTTMPEVNPGGTDYLDLAARWSPAAMGEETEAFHVALAKNFYESYERSEEHTSELQSLMRISYAVFCLKKKTISPVRTS